MADHATQTPLSELVQRALEKMASGEWRLILEHPDPAQGTSVCGFDVGQAIAADLDRLRSELAKAERERGTWRQLSDDHKANELRWYTQWYSAESTNQALRAALENLCREMRHMLRANPDKDGGLYRQRLAEAETVLGECKHGCDDGGICLADLSGFPQSCPQQQGEALASAPAEQGEAGVTVRPLEWRFFDVSHDFGKGVWDANSEVGTYTIECCGEKYPDEPFYLKKVSKTFTDIEAAKSAAQADYEKRIRSALALPEKGLDERTEEGDRE